MRQVDVVIGNEEDFTACLGLEVEGTDDEPHAARHRPVRGDDQPRRRRVPEPAGDRDHAARRTQRDRNDWGAIAWSRTHGFATATPRSDLEILDRVGGGDSFVAGLTYGLMQHNDLTLAVEYGAAHGALAMTTPGDTSTATLAEVEALVSGSGARVKR